MKKGSQKAESRDSPLGQLPAFSASPEKGFDTKIILVAAGILVVVVLVIILGVALLFFSPDPSNLGAFVPSGIALIPLKGEITNEDSGSFVQNLTANRIAGLIDEAEKNPAVGAILLDIDSPGGEAVASKQIVYRIRQSSKPVYSYINSMGASGGYYVAASTDYIMADEDSLTGSIGAISVFLNFEELFNKIGVKASIIKEGDLKAMGNPFTEMTEREKEMFQVLLSEVYTKFRDDVLEFRAGKMTREELESIADGRVMSGRQAYKKHMVDELVPRTKAIDRAAELAGIKNPQVINYGEQEFGLSRLFFESGKAFGSGFISSMDAGAQKIKIK